VRRGRPGIRRDLFSEIFETEEDHVDFIDTQVDLIPKIAIENYIQLSGPAEQPAVGDVPPQWWKRLSADPLRNHSSCEALKVWLSHSVSLVPSACLMRHSTG
jgi:hypothetical protein